MCGALRLVFWVKESGEDGALPVAHLLLQKIIRGKVLVSNKLPNKFFIEISPMIRFGNAGLRHADIKRQLGVLDAAMSKLTQAFLNDVGHAPHEVPTFSVIEIESDFLNHKRSFLVID
jgi:hypothetical protein